MSFRKLYNSVKSAVRSFTTFTPLEKQPTLENEISVEVTPAHEVETQDHESDEETVF